MSLWKFCESPLVDGEKLVCTPGSKEAGLVALDKNSGAVLWKCALPELGPKGKDGAAYSSVVTADIDGQRQYVQILGRGAVGVAADSGRFLWGYDRGPVVLVEANPGAFRIKGRFNPPTDAGPAWPYPVIHQKKLYLRHSNILLCYELDGTSS